MIKQRPGGTPFTRYEDCVVEDRANHVKRNFHATSGKWAISGSSMGRQRPRWNGTSETIEQSLLIRIR